MTMQLKISQLVDQLYDYLINDVNFTLDEFVDFDSRLTQADTDTLYNIFRLTNFVISPMRWDQMNTALINQHLVTVGGVNEFNNPMMDLSLAGDVNAMFYTMHDPAEFEKTIVDGKTLYETLHLNPTQRYVPFLDAYVDQFQRQLMVDISFTDRFDINQLKGFKFVKVNRRLLEHWVMTILGYGAVKFEGKRPYQYRYVMWDYLLNRLNFKPTNALV